MDYIQNTRSMMRVLESTIRLHWELTALSDYDTDIRFTFHDLALTIRRMHRFFESKKPRAAEPAREKGTLHYFTLIKTVVP